MTDISEKEVASALKWTFVIIVLSIAYSNFAPNYYFMKQGNEFYRGNKVTGSIERYEWNEWVDLTENELSRLLREDRKTEEYSRAKITHKRLADAGE